MTVFEAPRTRPHRGIGAAATVFLLAAICTLVVPSIDADMLLEIDGEPGARLSSVGGGYPRLRLGPSTRPQIIANPLNVRMSVGISRGLSDWLVAASGSAMPPRKALALVRTHDRSVVDRLVLDAPSLVELQFLGLSDGGEAVELRAKFLGSEIKVLGAGPLVTVPPTRSAAVTGRIVFEGLAVAPIAIENMGLQRTSDGRLVCNDFDIVAEHRDIAELFGWYSAGVLRPTAGGPPTRRADVALLDLNGTAKPLATLSGVAMIGFEPFTESDGTMRVKGSFACQELNLVPGAFQ